MQQLEIPETPISLSSLFGEPGSDPDILPDRLIWWAKVYEGLKGGPEWMSNLGLIVSQPQSLSPVSPGAASLNDELVSRILDIFEDGQIDDVTYAKNETTKRMEIKTGSSKALMDALIFPLDQDSYFAQEFLCAYRFFLSGQDLLDTLVGWYNVDAQDADKRDLDFLRLHRRQIQVKVMSVLLSWVRDHFQDFLANRTLHGQLMLFVKYLSQASYGDHQKITTAVREQWLNWYSYLYIPPIAQIANSLSEIRCSIMDVDSEYFAYHLTAIDHLLYRQVKQNAYLSLLVESVPKAGAGYQTGLKMILEHVSWFRSVAYYVSSIINKEESVKRRTLAIKRFLRVARHLFKLGNFFGLFAVMHGLRRPHSLVCVAAWEVCLFVSFDILYLTACLLQPFRA